MDRRPHPPRPAGSPRPPGGGEPPVPFDLRLKGRLLTLLVQGLGHTCRVELVAGGEHLRALLDDDRPAILVFWHAQAFFGTYFVSNRLIRQGLDVTLLTSPSRDGELTAQVAHHWGARVVRGSSSQTGPQALRGTYRAITRHGSSPLIVPDGPRGPARELKPGVIGLASMAGVPILPLAFAARHAWRLRSWDRLEIPRPFTRIAAVAGAPEAIPRGLSDEEQEGERRRIQEILDELTRRAAAAAARR